MGTISLMLAPKPVHHHTSRPSQPRNFGLDAKTTSPLESAALDRLQPQGLSRLSGGCVGQLRVRIFFGPNGPASALGQTAQGFWQRVVELVDDHDGDTYRAVYTVRFETAVYVLHAFKKKSKRGIKTPSEDLTLIKRRFRDAEADNAERMKREINS